MALTAPAIRRETLMRFRKYNYASAKARVGENNWVEQQIAIANAMGIKPRIIVQAETRKSA